jgi:membrane protein
MASLSIRNFLHICASAFKRWRKKDPFMHSAVVAYYAIFSMPGLLVIVVALTSLFFQRDVITTHVFNQISSIMGVDTATQIQNMINGSPGHNKTVVATILGVVTILIGASGVFKQLQKALNNIWEVSPSPRKKVFTMLRTRLFSFGLILTVGFLLLVSLLLTTMLAALSTWILSHWPDFILFLFVIFNMLLSFAVVRLLFAFMFKILPDAKVEWKHVWLGSMLTSFLFILGKSAIGFYLSKTNPGSAYGAAGSVVLILVWVSYSSVILFYGAEFTRAFADHITGRVNPTEIAEKKIDPKQLSTDESEKINLN